MELDPKQRRKYDKLVAQADELEDEQPLVSLELYKQAESIIPNSLNNEIARVKAKAKSGNKSRVNLFDEPPPPPPPIATDSSSPSFSLPDFADLPSSSESLPPPPPPVSTSTPSSPFSGDLPPPPPPFSPSSESDTASDIPNEPSEFDAFLDQVVDFIQVMSYEDVVEMVTRKDNQFFTYLMTSAPAQAPCADDGIPFAHKMGKCLLLVSEVVPSTLCIMAEKKVASWALKWIKVLVKRKVDAVKNENFYTEYDEFLRDILQLFSVVCGQDEQLSDKEKDQLDDFEFISLMIQFTIDEWNFDEDSELANVTVVSLFAVSSQFRRSHEDPVVCGLYTTPQAAELGRIFIHVTNRGVKPKWLQGAALSTAKKLFDYSQSQQNECFFFTNDVHVLLDIILREVINLDEPETKLRSSYLSLLQSIVDNHEYRSKGSHKIDDVSEFLRGISQIEYDPVAADLASRILQESVNG